MNFGRAEIYTDYREVNNDNVIQVLQDAMPIHLGNVAAMNKLIDFDAGYQPLPREKTKRPDIDIHAIDNLAHEAVAFNEAYHWGNPITFVQRGVKDNGNDNAEKESDAIALFNECYAAENADSKIQKLGRWIEITGLAYTFVDVNMDWVEGESYFKYETLDPRYAFVVKSSKLGHKPMLGVTYSEDKMGNRFYTCFTNKKRYEIVSGKIMNGKTEEEKEDWYHESRSGELNPLGLIPITECQLSYDRMGCFEREIDGLNSLNLLESDVCNASDETVQAIWHTNDVIFPKDENGNTLRPEHGDWMQTFTSPDGKTPFVTPLSINFDYSGNIQFINAKRAYLLEQLCIPARNDNSGGSTGIAMDNATGWNAAENKANALENITKGWKMEEAKVALEAIKQNPHVPADSPLLTLRAMDMQPSIKRNKNYELTVKAQFISTMLNAGIYGEHVLKEANVFPDPHQVWIDSKPTIEKIQEKLFKETEKKEEVEVQTNISEDPINQIENSPNVDKSRA